MPNANIPSKNTGDKLTATEFNDLVTAVNSKADKLDISALSGTTWNIDTEPLKELTLAANTSLTTTGTAAKARGVLIVNNPSAYTLTINGVSVAIKNSGESAVTVIYKTSGIYYSSDAGGGVSGGGTGATALSAPTGLTAVVMSATEIDLLWTDTNTTPAESGYKIYYGTTNSFASATLAATAAVGATGYNLTGLTASTLYYFWVVAAGNGSTTSDSTAATASATTNAAGPTVDPAAQAYFNAVEAAGATMSQEHKDAFNTWVTGEKSAGRWAKYKQVTPMYGTSFAQTKINAKTPGTKEWTNGTGFAYNMGFDPDGTINAQALSDLNLSASSPTGQDLTLTDFHLTDYIAETGAGYYDAGFYAAGCSILISQPSATQLTCKIADDVFKNQTISSNKGIITLSRTAADACVMAKDGTTWPYSDAVGATPSGNYIQLALGLPRGLTSDGSTRKHGFCIIGQGLTATEIQAQHTNLQTLLTAWGK